MCNVRTRRKLANGAGCLSFWHSLITLISHSLGWRIGNFPFSAHTHTHTDTHTTTAAPKPNHKNALIRGKRGAKNYTQTLRCGYIEGKSVFPQQLARPIAEFVYESGSKSNRKKTLGEKEKCSPALAFSALSLTLLPLLSRHSFYFSFESHVSGVLLS